MNRSSRTRRSGAATLPGPADQYIRILRRNLPMLRHRYRVRSLRVFGSFVRGEHRRGSDLDVLVDFNRPLGLFKFIELEHEISRLLGVRVDLVMKDALKPTIGKRILDEVVPV